MNFFQENGLKRALCNNEEIEGYKGCNGDDQLKTKNVSQNRTDQKQKGKVGSYHENIFHKNPVVVLEAVIL